MRVHGPLQALHELRPHLLKVVLFGLETTGHGLDLTNRNHIFLFFELVVRVILRKFWRTAFVSMIQIIVDVHKVKILHDFAAVPAGKRSITICIVGFRISKHPPFRVQRQVLLHLAFDCFELLLKCHGNALQVVLSVY